MTNREREPLQRKTRSDVRTDDKSRMWGKTASFSILGLTMTVNYRCDNYSVCSLGLKAINVNHRLRCCVRMDFLNTGRESVG